MKCPSLCLDFCASKITEIINLGNSPSIKYASATYTKFMDFADPFLGTLQLVCYLNGVGGFFIGSTFDLWYACKKEGLTDAYSIKTFYAVAIFSLLIGGIELLINYKKENQEKQRLKKYEKFSYLFAAICGLSTGAALVRSISNFDENVICNVPFAMAFVIGALMMIVRGVTANTEFLSAKLKNVPNCNFEKELQIKFQIQPPLAEPAADVGCTKKALYRVKFFSRYPLVKYSIAIAAAAGAFLIAYKSFKAFTLLNADQTNVENVSVIGIAAFLELIKILGTDRYPKAAYYYEMLKVFLLNYGTCIRGLQYYVLWGSSADGNWRDTYDNSAPDWWKVFTNLMGGLMALNACHRQINLFNVQAFPEGWIELSSGEDTSTQQLTIRA